MSAPAPSPRQIELLHHTLGLSPRCRESYRNHYVAGPGHHATADLLELVDLGLMERARTPSFLVADAQVFRVTDAGKAVAQQELPAPPKLTKYQQWLKADCPYSFGDYLLGSSPLPKVEYGGTCSEPLHRMYRVEAGYCWSRDVEGAWCRTKKGAKASYKAALKEHQRLQRERKKTENAA